MKLHNARNFQFSFQVTQIMLISLSHTHRFADKIINLLNVLFHANIFYFIKK